ncbi:hypothetical protein DMC25_06420 [Caulobacter sp. D4A]|uniref:hypothetical protein n=1 Tax=Caulobacter sp. D4A TaxID=2204171 RepID=UPI000D734FE3|nr:hypothetical protein [Caulobacter sp. D4A]PXA91184.1 hypothetical protein DMC25_06420 [Caulobacter sp. D4A]
MAKTPTSADEAAPAVERGVLETNDVVQSFGQREYPKVTSVLESGAVMTTYVDPSVPGAE